MGGFSGAVRRRSSVQPSPEKRIESDGIEAAGEISRVSASPSPDDFSQQLYVRYRDRDGREREALLMNAEDITVGTRVRIRYHPKNMTSAMLVKVLDN